MPLDFRYRRLGYVALNVSDMARSRAFYETLVGLEAAGSAGDEQLFRCTGRHHDVVLHEGPEPGLRRIAWEMESPRDLALLRTHLATLGLVPVDVAAAECARLGLDEAFRLVEPHTGASFEYFHGMADADRAYAPTVAKIARLGHVVLQTDTHAETEQFFLEALNFRASDRIEGAVTFMRCFPNPLHHSFGLSNGASRRLHHVNFMVTDIDDIGRALYRMQKNGVRIVFGPGRHPPSESIFLYFLDPDGLTVEYSFGMEEFPERMPREPRLLPKALSSIDYWGSVPDPDFAANGVIECATAGDA
jgi:2,3-dihydroxy-p-cumate/2,3-dihydroxybenzoate 3,4-dioxygenase